VNYNFLKEMIIKNDLTYLSIGLAFIFTLHKDIFITIYTVVCLSLLLYSWIMTFKKRYIFNSNIKVILPFIVFLAIGNYTINAYHLEFKGMQAILNIVIVSLYSLALLCITYCLYENAEEYYEGEYYPELDEQYQINAYLRSVYSSLDYNNTIKYHYDSNTNVYICEDILYDGTVIKKKEKSKISTLSAYLKYLSANNLSFKEISIEEFTVFKMFAI